MKDRVSDWRPGQPKPVWREMLSYLDDDDGFTDEAGPPGSAEALLGRPAGSLKAMALAAGTYFTTLRDYEAWRRASSPACRGERRATLTTS